MLCQNCCNKEATIHINRIADGEAVQLHLCNSCAQHLGYSNLLSGLGLGLSSVLSSFFPDVVNRDESEGKSDDICPQCGISFEEVVKNGMMGCDNCYKVFYPRLKSSISRIHGRATHVGKMSITAGDSKDENADTAARLRQEMSEAIEREDFERAAEIRDELKVLRGDSK